MAKMPVEDKISKIAEREMALRKELGNLIADNSEVFKQKDFIEDELNKLEQEKLAIKDELVKNNDFDLHQVGKLKVSVSRVVKVVVDDIGKVPDAFKETKVVANEKKAQEYVKVMGEIPEGFTDKSYYRFSWRDGGAKG